MEAGRKQWQGIVRIPDFTLSSPVPFMLQKANKNSVLSNHIRRDWMGAFQCVLYRLYQMKRCQRGSEGSSGERDRETQTEGKRGKNDSSKDRLRDVDGGGHITDKQSCPSFAHSGSAVMTGS